MRASTIVLSVLAACASLVAAAPMPAPVPAPVAELGETMNELVERDPARRKTTTTKKVAAAAVAVVAAKTVASGSFSGKATYYLQNGNAGSCGKRNSDSAFIVAVNSNQMNSGLCGRSVSISSGGKTVVATVADTCPGCGYGSLDLSRGLFQQFGSLGQGVLPISWSFI